MIVIIGRENLFISFLYDYLSRELKYKVIILSDKELLDELSELEISAIIIDCYSYSSILSFVKKVINIKFCNILLINCFEKRKTQWERFCNKNNISGCLYPDMEKKDLEQALLIITNCGKYFKNISMNEKRMCLFFCNDELTNREMEVLFYLKLRYTNKMIANVLKISKNTVNVHVSRILQKKSISSRYDLFLNQEEFLYEK